MSASESSRALEQALADRYRLERELGAGGMATVYLAEDLRHRRRVALKVLRPDLSAVLGAERFSKEIELTANLQHANILPLFDSGEAAGQLFYVMPFVDGETLRDRMARGPVPVNDALAILRDVARALGHAHTRGVVHRDIKPENILLAGGAAVVADFGIAKALSASRTASEGANATLTSIGTSIGTPAYMAPEQAAGDPATGPGADVYAWGVVAYELLARRHPFAEQVTPQALMAAHIATEPKALGEVRSGLPAALTPLVMECLTKSPEKRPRDGEALAARLAAISGSGEMASLSTGRSRALRIAAPLGALALVAVAAWASMRGARPAPSANERTIAVIPFDVGADTANLYVADGLTAELTTKLSRIPGIVVRAYSSSKMMRGEAPRIAARELGVSAVVTASMVRAQSRLRVNASLVDASDERVLWSQSFDGEDADQFALQDRLAEAIAGAMRVTLSPATRSAVAAGRTNDPVAHDLVQRARFLLDRIGDSTSVREAIRLAEDATRRDSMYVDAWTALSAAWLYAADDVVPAATVLEPARRAVERALTLAPSDPWALGWAGAMHAWYLRDSTTGAPLLRRALEFDSTSDVALAVLGTTLHLTDADAGARMLARGIRFNPLSSITLIFTLWAPDALRHLPADSAKLACARLTSFVSKLGAQCEAVRLGQLGRTAEAQAVLRGIDTVGMLPNEWAYLAMSATSVSDTILARTALERVEQIARSTYVREDAVAIAYARLGDDEQAIRWWTAGLKSRCVGIINARRAEFNRLRTDPRFKLIVAGESNP